MATSLPLVQASTTATGCGTRRTGRAQTSHIGFRCIEAKKDSIAGDWDDIPPLGDVMLISMFLWLTFSILGTQFYVGKFYTCPPSGPRG